MDLLGKYRCFSTCVSWFKKSHDFKARYGGHKTQEAEAGRTESSRLSLGYIVSLRLALDYTGDLVSKKQSKTKQKTIIWF
jgi:hypothetical protein